jgi:uncharacterized protein with ParB-like and HNH nuclease domain
MSYQTALTISEIVNDIHKKKYVLPAIQREFVWDTYQIERLFDSLMRDYPISSFLFWLVTKDKIKDYEFYEFLREYHERNKTHNPKASLTGEDEVTAVLDGQQRLTSLYVGLKGSYAYKLPRKRVDNPDAYPNRFLCLNLLKPSEDPEFEYDFSFLTSEELKDNDDEHFWFKVGKILSMKEQYDVNQYLIDNGLLADYGKEKASFANKSLFKLHSVIHTKPSISYYLERDTKLDKVLNIFIRINSGGTILSYSDLLLSIATAQWEEKDAREEITGFVDLINNIGDGFNFNKDFVLKSCLVMSDFNNIAFKVDNFKKKNMLKIEKDWDDITKYLKLAVGLVASFGYSRDTLASNYTVIPIAYYLKSIAAKDSYITSSKNSEDKANIRKWLILSLIKRVFGGQPDNVLRPIIKAIKGGSDGFPLEQIKKHFKGTNKTILFSDEDIDNLLWSKYGQGFTYSVLALLYPNQDYTNVFHVDHIFPKSKFNRPNLRKLGLTDEQIAYYQENVNYIANLQLLLAIPNIEKQDKDIDKWISETFPTPSKRKDYFEKHYIPDIDLKMTNFEKFVEDREELIKKQFKSILQ